MGYNIGEEGTNDNGVYAGTGRLFATISCRGTSRRAPTKQTSSRRMMKNDWRNKRTVGCFLLPFLLFSKQSGLLQTYAGVTLAADTSLLKFPATIYNSRLASTTIPSFLCSVIPSLPQPSPLPVFPATLATMWFSNQRTWEPRNPACNSFSLTAIHPPCDDSCYTALRDSIFWRENQRLTAARVATATNRPRFYISSVILFCC